MKKKFLFVMAALAFPSLLLAQVALVKECQVLNGWAYLAASSNKIFFAAGDSAHGYEPWVSDGTTAGTQMLKDIYPGTTGGMFFGNTYAEQNSHIVYNNEFYFIASDAIHEFELWKSDGTENGTIMVKDINPFGSMVGSNFNDYPYFCILNGMLFFEADDGSHGSELWKTDGTTVGTVMVKDLYSGFYGSEPFGLIAFNNEVFFRAWGDNGGRELWKSDGTDAGTVMVKDILPGPYGSFSNVSSSVDPHFFVSGNYLYFRTNIDSTSYQAHLWRTDGTGLGTIQLENHLSQGYLDETENACTDVNGIFYFIATDNTPSYLWKSDGTAIGTANVTTNNSLSAIENLFNLNGILMFDGHDNSGDGLCRSDGSASGSYMVKTFPGLGSSATVGGFATDGSFLYFGVLAAINANAMEWRVGQSNGTSNGTVRIPHYGFIGGLLPFNGKMYYGGYDTIINSSHQGLGLYAFTPVNVGVNEIFSEENLSVFPNPANQFVVCTWSREFASVLSEKEISMFDLAGRKVLSEKVAPGKDKISVNVSELPEGMYLLKIEGENFIATEKISVVR